MIVTDNYSPMIEDFSKDGKLSLQAVLKIFENMGNKHSDIAGKGVYQNNESSTAWILTEWSVEAESFPNYTDSIKAQTWSQGLSSPLVALRDFLLYQNDSVCIRGTTRWVLFDTKAGRLCKIEKDLIDKYKPEDKKAFEDSKLAKIPVPETFEKETVIKIRRSDFDFNDHIHNLVYLDYALESLPEEIYKNSRFTKLRITYKNEIKTEKEITGKYAQIEGKKIVAIYGDQSQLKALIQLQ